MASNKKNKIIYWVSTGLLSAMALMSAGMYFFSYDMVTSTFTALGYPTYIIYPLGVAKVLGIVAIWTRKSHMLKEWAYAGFFFDFALAASAHINVNDGEYAAAFVAMVLLFVSYSYEKKAFSA